jgi:uncharacterized protein (DUF1501 family)
MATLQTQRSKTISRRGILMSGVVAGVATALGIPAFAKQATGTMTDVKNNDLKILNNALYYEHQVI